MISFFEEVKDKINNKLNPENIIIIDNSHLHSKHKSFVVRDLCLRNKRSLSLDREFFGQDHQ